MCLTSAKIAAPASIAQPTGFVNKNAAIALTAPHIFKARTLNDVANKPLAAVCPRDANVFLMVPFSSIPIPIVRELISLIRSAAANPLNKDLPRLTAAIAISAVLTKPNLSTILIIFVPIFTTFLTISELIKFIHIV